MALIDNSLVFNDATIASGTNGTGVFPTSANATLNSNIIPLRGTAGELLAGTAAPSYGDGAYQDLWWVITVPTAFVGGTSVDFQLRTSNTISSGALVSPTVIDDTTAIVTASLVAGQAYSRALPLQGCKVYVDVLATGVGTFSAGAFNAYISDKPFQGLNVPLYAVQVAV